MNESIGADFLSFECVVQFVTMLCSKELSEFTEYIIYNARPPKQYSYSSCSATETHAVKLCVQSFPADVNAGDVYALCSVTL